MPEQSLNSPSFPIQLECFFALKTIAQNEQLFGTGTLAHSLTGKEKLQAKGFLAAFDLIVPADGKRCCMTITHQGIAFDAGNVGDALAIEPFKPLVTNELPIHCEHINSFGS